MHVKAIRTNLCFQSWSCYPRMILQPE